MKVRRGEKNISYSMLTLISTSSLLEGILATTGMLSGSITVTEWAT